MISYNVLIVASVVYATERYHCLKVTVFTVLVILTIHWKSLKYIFYDL